MSFIAVMKDKMPFAGQSFVFHPPPAKDINSFCNQWKKK
ncbi:hypothetical protein B4098_2441 [Heyndrickxia coagulans]|uniref:Uncharacterized protein n=1 Tax=Heyndrickxia coagulans TaxID=1398 RepID=A0A150JNE3_HEYCO|nr:hypothetical protein B4098_2441 [Heyndrickxia coagulans]